LRAQCIDGLGIAHHSEVASPQKSPQRELKVGALWNFGTGGQIGGVKEFGSPRATLQEIEIGLLRRQLRYVIRYREQWEKLLAMADEIRTFVRKNDSALKTKEWVISGLVQGLRNCRCAIGRVLLVAENQG
jgi:hypothetical protein